MKPEPATLIGLDLGAFATTALASNGRSVTFRSCVGSASASRISDRDAIVGTDWAELRHVVEPLAGGRLKFLSPGCSGAREAELRTALRCLVRHAVSRLAPNPNGQLFGVMPIPARASDLNRSFLLDAVSGILDACLLVPSPVATAYGLGQLTRTLVVDVGAGTVDMAVFDGEGNLPRHFDQITLPTGLTRTDQTFSDEVRTQCGIELSLDEARGLREQHGTARGHIAGAIVQRQTGEEVCVSDCLKQACRSLVTSITTALQEIAQGGTQKPETVVLTGGGSRMRGLSAVISELIPDANVLVPYNLEQCEAQGALAMAQHVPIDSWAQLQLSGQAGIETALSAMARAA